MGVLILEVVRDSDGRIQTQDKGGDVSSVDFLRESGYIPPVGSGGVHQIPVFVNFNEFKQDLESRSDGESGLEHFHREESAECPECRLDNATVKFSLVGPIVRRILDIIDNFIIVFVPPVALIIVSSAHINEGDDHPTEGDNHIYEATLLSLVFNWLFNSNNLGGLFSNGLFLEFIHYLFKLLS